MLLLLLLLVLMRLMLLNGLRSNTVLRRAWAALALREEVVVCIRVAARA